MVVTKLGSSLINNTGIALKKAVSKSVPDNSILKTGISRVAEDVKPNKKSKVWLGIKRKFKRLFSKKTKNFQNAQTSKPRHVKEKNSFTSYLTEQAKSIKKKVTTAISKKGRCLSRTSKLGRVFPKAVTRYSSLFSKEGIKSVRLYLDTVVKSFIKRQEAKVKTVILRRVAETKIDYSNCEKQLVKAVAAYHKAIKKGDKVGVMFAKSHLMDAKTSFEIAERYMKLAQASYKNAA